MFNFRVFDFALMVSVKKKGEITSNSIILTRGGNKTCPIRTQSIRTKKMVLGIEIQY